MNKTEIVRKLRSIGPGPNQNREIVGRFGNVLGKYSWYNASKMVLFIPIANHNHNWYAFVPYGNNRVSFAYFTGNNTNMNWRFHNSNRDREIFFASNMRNFLHKVPNNRRTHNVPPAA